MAKRADDYADVNEQRRKKYPPLYDLTHFTGKDAQSDRGGALFGFIEYSRRHRLIFLIALFPAIIVTAVLAPMAGSLSVFGFVITQALFFFLMEARSRKGLKLRMYQTVYDKQVSIDGMLILCGKPVAPENLHQGWIVFSNTPVDQPAADSDGGADEDDLAIYTLTGSSADSPTPTQRPGTNAPLRGRRTTSDDDLAPMPLADLLPTDLGENTLV